MSDLSLENQNTAEHQTELIATGEQDPNQLGRLFPDGIVLQVKPGANTVGNFDGIQGIGGGTGNGVSGFSNNGNAFNGRSVTNDGVVGTTDSAGKSGVLGLNSTLSHQSFSFGVFGVSSQGIGVGGRTDNFIGVHGVCVNLDQTFPGLGVKGDNLQNGTGVLGTSVNGPGTAGISTNGPGISGTSTGGTGVAGTSVNGFGVTGGSTGGTAVAGLSVNGSGVAGSSVNGSGVTGNSAENGSGVAGTGVKGPGVTGTSTGDRGGVFASDRSAQLRLVPIVNPTGGLPQFGQFGDVYLRLRGDPDPNGTATIEMFLCIF